LNITPACHGDAVYARAFRARSGGRSRFSGPFYRENRPFCSGHRLDMGSARRRAGDPVVAAHVSVS